MSVDSPSQALGVHDPPGVYTPWKYDNIPEESHGPIFAKWVSSYFKHGDLSSRDFSQLKQREIDTSKQPTTDTIPLEELLTIVDFGPGTKCEIILSQIEFSSILIKQRTKALLDPQVREDWGRTPVWFIYSNASPWNVHYAAWDLEKKVEPSEINFKLIPNVNHFVRRCCPSICLAALKRYVI